MQNLQNIFESITPDNIKNVPVIKDAMAIFIETLEELSKESIDIRNMFENPVIKEELVKIYLDDLYKVFKTLQVNQKVVEKIEKINAAFGTEYYKVDVIFNIAKYINEEHFLTFKSYKEKKGTEDAIRYIYELVGRKLLSEDSKVPFALIEYEPFNFNVSGNLPSELYEAVVRPLAHPLGFVYQYSQLVSILLEDVFLSTISYNTNALEVRCLLPNGTTNVTNYKYEIDGVTPRVVKDIQTTETGLSSTKKIIFQDDKYLEQITTSLGQTSVYYKAQNGDTLVAYDTHQCSIYFDYEFILTTTIVENFNNVQSEIKNDNVARLNPLNNQLSHIETGFNGTRNMDGDYLFFSSINIIIGTPDQTISDTYTIGDIYSNTGLILIGSDGINIGDAYTIYDHYLFSSITGRQENYYEPSIYADLKMLEGKYAKDVVILHPNTNAYVETQPIRYNDTVNPAFQVVPFVLSSIVYDNQNTENTANIGKEHLINQNYSRMSNENEAEITYINAATIVIGTPDINIGQIDGLGNTFNIYETHTVNDDNLYRYYYISYSNDEPLNISTTTDDIYDGVVTRDAVVLTDHNYAIYLNRSVQVGFIFT